MASDANSGGPRSGYIAGLFSNEWFMPGLLFIGLGMLGLYVSRDYEMGNVNQMGPGYFPRMLCIGLIGLGSIIAWIGLFAQRPTGGKGSASRGFVLIISAMAIFALTIEGMKIPLLDVKLPSLGFIGALTLTLLVASIADRTQKLWEALLTTAIIVLLAVLVFTVALKLPFRLWPEL